ncbi:MAG TPA: hypothetical protein DCO72_00785 [Ruminococcus sp.]|nr:hypothetical protein [Ruminococcus sp.]
MGSILMTCVVIAVVCAVIVVATLSLNKSSKIKDDIAIVISGLAATPIAIIVGLPLMWGIMTAVIKPVVHAMDSISSISSRKSNDHEDTYTGSPQYYKDASDYFKKHPDELYK